MKKIEKVEIKEDTKYAVAWKMKLAREYAEVKERYTKLHDMLVKYDAGTLEYSIRGKVKIFRRQAKAMEEYLYCLEVRAKADGIIL